MHTRPDQGTIMRDRYFFKKAGQPLLKTKIG